MLRPALLLPVVGLSGCAGSRGLPAFEHALAAQDSATAALSEWCRTRKIADSPIIRAERVTGADLPASAAIRRELRVDGGEALGYRHVRLTCGGATLSVAHNWYVPGRIPPAMNRILETTDTPFGKVVAPLGFTRELLMSRRGPAEDCPSDTVLAHRALLRLPDGRPLSLVIECYTRANLAR